MTNMQNARGGEFYERDQTQKTNNGIIIIKIIHCISVNIV